MFLSNMSIWSCQSAINVAMKLNLHSLLFAVLRSSRAIPVELKIANKISLKLTFFYFFFALPLLSQVIPLLWQFDLCSV